MITETKCYLQGNVVMAYLSVQITPSGFRDIDYIACSSRIFTAINNVTSDVSSIASLSGGQGCPLIHLRQDSNNLNTTYLCQTAAEARLETTKHVCCT